MVLVCSYFLAHACILGTFIHVLSTAHVEENAGGENVTTHMGDDVLMTDIDDASFLGSEAYVQTSKGVK